MGRNPEADARARASRRQQLIEDAFHIFAEKTIDKLSMNEVADACGVGIATLYRHFSTKNALVLAVSTVLNTVYFARAILRFYTKNPNPDAYSKVRVREQKTYILSASVFAALNLFFGIFAKPLIDILAGALSVF